MSGLLTITTRQTEYNGISRLKVKRCMGVTNTLWPHPEAVRSCHYNGGVIWKAGTYSAMLVGQQFTSPGMSNLWPTGHGPFSIWPVGPPAGQWKLGAWPAAEFYALCPIWPQLSGARAAATTPGPLAATTRPPCHCQNGHSSHPCALVWSQPVRSPVIWNCPRSAGKSDTLALANM